MALPVAAQTVNSYPLLTKETERRLPAREKNVLKTWIETLVRRKTYLTVLYVIVFIIAFAVASTKAVQSDNDSNQPDDENYRYGLFFQWFAIIFIPGITFANLVVQMPLSLGLNLTQMVTMIFFFVYYFRGHGSSVSSTTESDYINLYIVAVVWSIASAHGLANPFSVFNSAATALLDLGILTVVISGGVGLNYRRRV